MKQVKFAIWRFFAEEANKKDLLRAIFAGFIMTVIFSLLPFFVSCEEISNEVLRLHVIANSDSEEDQALKLEVRDAVLLESAKWYETAESFIEANGAVCMHLQSIEAAAQEVMESSGCDDTLNVEVTDMYFDTRDYEDFSLPAGKYRTLRITIGEGKGKNWWCMVYPALCLPAAEVTEHEVEEGASQSEETEESQPDENAAGEETSENVSSLVTEQGEKQNEDDTIKEETLEDDDDILSGLTDEERKIIENSQNFVIRFQILEWYQKLMEYLDN